MVAGPPWWTPIRASLVLVALLILFFVLFSVNRIRLKSKISERTRLATELHDYLAQDLTAISYQLTAAKRARQNDLDDSRALNTADRMLGSCRTKLRRCLYDLRNDALDEPDFARAVEITLRPLAKDVKCAVTHGKASRFSISGLIKDRQLVFTVRDNGCGFDSSSAPAQEEGHFGLSGVRERLRKLSGKITISSAPNERLPDILRRIHAGESVFSPEIEQSLCDLPSALTVRQREILAKVADGYTSADIADGFAISADAINKHINQICSRLGAANRTEAVAIALRRRLI